jgi:pyrimidine-specific ribonucleoside hydrolase
MAGGIPLVVDCDPGIDDAVALALAVASPEVEVQAVTTVSGNAPVELTTRNALQLLHALGRKDVPVAAGARRALVRVGWRGLPSPHGENGLGGVELGECEATAAKEHAVDRLAGVLQHAARRSVTVVALGPLTNLALLLALRPECVEGIDRLVVMGGSTGRGNITPAAEFNVWTDPEAARRVLADSGLQVCLVGLDVTRRATLDERAVAELRAGSGWGGILASMIAGYGDRAAGGWPLHDALAVAAGVDPTLITTRPARVEVDTGVGAERGRTLCTFVDDQGSFDEPTPGSSATRCEVAVDVDVARFRDLVLSRVARGA